MPKLLRPSWSSFFLLLVSIGPGPGAFAQSYSWAWAQGLNGSGDEEVADLATDNTTGAVYAVGYTKTDGLISATLGTVTGNQDAFLVKYSAAGAVVWGFTPSGAGESQATGVALDAAGNIYITGWFKSTIDLHGLSALGTGSLTSTGGEDWFIASYTPTGTLRWRAKLGGTADERPVGIAVSSNGAYAFGTVKTNISTPFGSVPASLPNGKLNLVLAKYSLLGVGQSLISGGSGQDELAKSVVADDDGVYVACRTKDDNLLWYGPTGVLIGSAAASGEWDQRVTAFSGTGVHDWTITVGELSDGIEQAPSKLAVGCGALYLTGMTHGPATFAGVGTISSTTHDFFYLGRIERATGQFLWVNKGTSTGPNHTTGGTDLAVGRNGLVHVVGKFKDDLTMGTRSITSTNGKIQPFMASFRPTGTGASLEDLISSNDATANAITADDQGNFILAGTYKTNLACAALSLAGPNNLNGYLVKGSIPALSGVDISYWNAPATMCSNATPLDLSTLVSPYQTGNAAWVVTSSNVFSPPSILGGILGNYAQFNTANGYVTVDLGVTVPVGGIISLLWNANGSGATATTLVGTANPPTIAQSSFTTSSTTDVYTSIVLTTPARYIRITRAATSPSFDVDGVYYEYGNDLGGMWSGTGVSGSTFDPTGLSGPVSITYTVGTPPCTTSSSNSINVEAAPVGGSITSSVSGMVCPGNNSGTLTLSGHTGTITEWLMSTDGFATSTAIANTTTTQTFSNLLVTTQYRARVGVTGCGTALSGIHTVQVGDNTAPVITTCPPAQTIYVGATCKVALPDLLPSAAGTDNCSTSITWSQFPAAGALLNRGIHVVTITATDAAGNATTCNVTITAADNTAPVIAGCPSNVTLNADPGACSAIYNFAPPTATDNCNLVISAIDALAIEDVDGNVIPALLAPNEYPVGVTTRTFTFSDASGNTSTCSFTITVVDNQFPTVVSCPGNITVPADAGACGANVTYTLPTFNDNCLFRVDLTEGLASGAFFPVGTTQVKYLATDSSNNSVNCVFNVIVQDLQNPEITGCPSNIIVQAPLAGSGATATWAAPTATDNCGVAPISQTAGQAPGSFFLIGTHAITYTATDPNGGSSTCTFTVTVIGNDAPTITCPPNQVLYSTLVSCAQVFTYPTPPVSDDQPLPVGQPQQVDGTGYSSGSAFPKGITAQTWQVTDSDLNSITCTFTIQVIDTIKPTLVGCPTSIILNADPGTCGAYYSYTPPTATDNCDGPLTVVRIIGPASGSLFPIGSTLIRHRATDQAGRFRACSFTVTVVDNIFPTLANCPADMNVAAATNACGAYVAFASPTASDNCSAALTQTLGPVSGSLFPIGDTPVEFTATDPAGLAVTCSFNVHVDDTTPPTFTYCPDTISVTSTAGLCGAAVPYAAPVATDNCSSLMTLPAGQLSGDFFPVGYTSVTYTVSDGTNAPAICTFVVEVIDNQAPVINGLPGNMDMPNTAGVCEATITWAAPTASDNCSATLTSSHSSGDAFPVGTTTVTYTATDGTLSTQLTFLVTVTDNEEPTITCPANDTLSISSATCDVVMPVYAATATDNCAVDLIWQTAGPVAGDVLTLIGSPYSTTWYARDTTGNISTCVQSIVVIDADAPDVLCPLYDNIEYYLDANCQLAFPDLRDSVTVTDCSPWTNTMWPPAGMVFTGDTVVQMTMDIEDAFGNHVDNDHLIWIRDTIAPTFNCNLSTSYNSDPGLCGTNVSLPSGLEVDTLISDICDPNPTWTQIAGPSSGWFTPDTTYITYQATDASGNSSTCTFSIIVGDYEAPVVTCPGTISLPADLSCKATVPDVSGMALSATDNCTNPPVMGQDVPAGSLVQAGDIIQITATDAWGNVGFCPMTVVTIDSDPPVITNCPANLSVNADAGSCGAVVNYTAPVGTDNCSGATTALSAGLASGAMFPIGTTTVTHTVTDAAGLTASCSFTVTVTDNIAPTISCPANLNINVTSGCTATGVALGSPVTADNCGVASVTNNAPASYPVGVTTVTWTVTDNSGNTSTCDQTVTVSDNVDPTISCPANLNINVTSGCTATGVALGSPVTADNCGVASVTNNAPASYPVGVTTVTWTVTDNSGNTSTCDQTVTVSDNVDPTISCPANLNINVTSGCTATGVALGSPVTADNCGVASVTNNAPASYPVGVTIVTWTVTDNSGNTSTCDQTVTVTDNVDPTISCPANLNINVTSGCTATGVALGSPVTADNCGVASVTNNAPASYPVGVTTVTWTVTDNSGNTSTCDQTVTVTDNVDPTISCPANLNINVISGCTATGVALGSPVTADNCGVASVTNNAPASYPVGVTTVTWTVTDNSGNTSSCDQTVTVTDNVDPTISCPANLNINVTSGCTATGVALGSPVTADNCGVASVTNNAPASYPVGVTTVTWTVTDNSGNTSTCDQTVTVSDNVDPTISCPANLNINVTSGCTATGVALGSPVTADNCGVASVTNNAPASYPVGVTTVTWTVTDNSGNTSSCDQTVTVTDNVDPTISCPANLSVNADAGSCGAVVNYTAPVGTDNCSGATTTLTAGPASGSTFPIGTTTVIHTVTDAAGLTASCSFTVTVTDNIAPTISACPSDISVTAAPGACNATATWIAPTVSDNCPGAILTQAAGLPSGSSFPIGTTTITYTASDGINSSTCTFNVEVQATTVDLTYAVTAVCQGSAPMLPSIASPAGGVFSDANQNGTINITTGAFDPSVASPGFHTLGYVFAGGCTSHDWYTIEVIAAPSASISYIDAPYCSNEVSGAATISGTTGGGFTSSPSLAGLNAATGDIDIAASSPGTYAITYTIPAAGACPAFSTGASITIETAPTAAFNYAGPYCNNSGPQLPTFTGATGGTFSSTAGLSLNATTGQVIPGSSSSTSTGTTYTVTYTVGATAACGSFSTTTDVTITQAPWAGANGSLSICSNAAPVNLFGSLNGTPAGGGTWKDPANAPHSGIYDPAIDGPGTYAYIVAGGPGCAAHSAGVQVVESTMPAATISYANTPYCNLGNASVTQTGTGGGSYTSTAGLSINGSTGLVNLSASTPGSYSVTYAIPASGACPDFSTSAPITINPFSNAGLDSTLSICKSTATFDLATLLQGAQAGGTWKKAPNITLASSVITPGAYFGTTTFRYVINGQAGCQPDSAFFPITFVPYMSAGTSGTATFCSSGSTQSLIAYLGGVPVPGGAWTFGGVAHASTYDPATDVPGVYTYTITNAQPCANSLASVTVSEVQAPNAGSNGSLAICGDAPATSLFSQLGGTPDPTGTWSGPSPVIAGQYDPATMAPGTYTYTVNGTAPCANASATVSVTETNPVNPGILSGDQDICLGESSLFASTVAGGSWTSSNMLIATIDGNTGAIASIAPGTATMTYVMPANGPCPSASATRAITITNTTSNSATASACDSYTWSVNGTTYTASGNYTHVVGCHTETLDLTITPSTSNSTTASACDSYTWAVNGTTYTASGNYTHTVGCHTETLSLTITPSTSNSTTASACDSYTWAVNGTTYTASGNYTHTVGCHTETLALTITPSTSNSTTASACDSYTWVANGTTYSASGNYTHIVGCHTETLDLTITPSTSNSTSASACDSYTWAVNGTTYSASGNYTHTVGCHTETLSLTITPSTSNATTASACDSYIWVANGQTYTASGNYTHTVGCHTETLSLTITPSTSNSTTASACDSYTWVANGQTYTASGNYTHTVGCHTETLSLTITPSTSNSTTASACDSYTWAVNGTTYTASGNYTHIVGCHTETLDLTITPSTSNSTSASACDSYTWAVNGTTYSASGNYTHTVGCHTETLDLTITPSTSNSTTASACDSYTWAVNGTTYTASGNYTHTVGCHTETLDLTITPSTSNSTTASACDSYTWAVNGTTYTASGNYTHTVGCHTETLALTITNSTSNSTTASACDSYTWAVNGTTYTASGNYTHTVGCHTETLALTITNSTSNSTTASACDSYVWPVNGTTYTASGNYTHTVGCHTETLDLTITPSTSNATSASACDSYTWAVNGTTYTASGNYTHTVGCHTETLDLTITPSTSNSTTASACDSYTWAVNGTTYTASGNYTHTVGCHTETLDLTITPSTSNSTTASACDSYTWAVNGQTYSASGNYTHIVGCHTETLDLTITPSTSNSTTASACDSYVWPVNGTTYTASGNYTHTVGCHTETLDLTITPSTSNATSASACDSYTWAVNGTTYTASGIYSHVAGCVTEVLDLNITPSSTNTTTASACDSYTWAVNGTTYTASGNYTHTVGCHTETLALTITNSTSNSTTASACDSYVWPVNGTTYTASGNYTHTVGCHTETLALTITNSTSNSTTASACDSYVWPVNGTTYTASGTYTNVVGCHTETLVLTITNSTSISTTAAACDSYVWAVNGTTYTASGNYTHVVGCHTETLDLTITPSTSNATTASACDSYTWAVNGTTYSASGNYTHIVGCHTETLSLTITPSTSNSTTASACDSYTWAVNGTTYSASGNYTHIVGCHTETLSLTITPSTSNSTTASACDSYTWAVNGTTYTASGDYTHVVGCHTETLSLTITPSTSNSTTASACDSYTWAVNGTTYSASGNYTHTVGCHTETLDLTITPSTSNATSASACDSYTWAVNGTTYSASGIYSHVVGCVTEVLDLNITPSSTNTTTASACDSYTWAVNGTTYTASGNYTHIVGCHTETLDLTITPSTSNATSASACDSYTWAVSGTTYSASGNYTHTVGCHTETLDLTITPSTSNSTTASACDSYTWAVNGTTYTASGNYTHIVGCHTETLDLTITPSTSNATSASACDSYTWAVNGTTYSASGIYSHVVGCVTEVLDLNITPSSTNTTTASACDSYTWAVNGTTYTASGNYTHTVGCHTETLDLTITPSTSNATSASACDSYTWAVNGTTYTASGNYTHTVGCHTETLDLTITPSTSNSTTASACDSYTWAVNGTTYTASGNYTHTVGCHTETLDLTITPSTSNSTTASACDSYTWAVNGQTYSASGNYTHIVGCHTETLDLTITPSTSNSTTASACDSYTWAVNGTTYSASGNYTHIVGCHTETLALTITPSTSNSTTASACDSYTWAVNGTTYTASGNYTHTVGCHTETLDLTITPSTSNSTTASACDSYTWAVNGTTYTASGNYTHTVGCHTETLDLTITPSTSNSTTASACDSYVWPVNGTTYTASGTYTNVVGCHTETLVLTITNSTSISTTAAACDSYVWPVNGTTYTASGNYTHTVGCHTETLDLTITPSTSNATSASACDSYTWAVNGTTYSASGNYSHVVGCHTETLDLTITPSTSNSTTTSACDSYTWAVNGTTYSASGIYSHIVGCHTETLDLTITNSTSNSTTASACDSYVWPVNGTTYTASGNYTHTVGCHTETLDLTITPSTSNSTTASACDSYTWAVNGTTYSASGIYSHIVGCHTETLDLTITPSTSNSTTASACDSYTWAVNGTTYTASGNYTHTVGCHTETLALTITPSTSNSTTASACDSYTWAVNGTTYTASGNYTHIVGCHTETLDLTITPSTSNATTASACDSYTWAANGATYSASGNYTHIVGCHTETLDLTITPSTSNATSASACDSYTWAVNGTTYTASGIYSHVVGCVTEVLDLNITAPGGSSITESACGSFNWNGTIYSASGTYTQPNACGADTLHLSITGTPDAEFAYAQSTYCHGDAPPTPWVAQAGGQFSSFPTGLVLDPASGAIAINPSDPGTYTITYAFTGACPASSMQTVTIVANADPSWIVPPALCSTGTTVELSMLVTGTPGGSWQGQGVSNGIFNPAGLSGAIPLTYTATIGSCTAQLTQSILVQTPPIAMAGPDIGVCGLITSMSAVANGNPGLWTVPPGIALSAITDPSAGIEATAYGTYTMIWTVSNGACTATDTALVTFTDPGIGLWVDAGEDQYLEVIDHTNLHGSASPGATLSWWVLAGGGSISQPTDSSTSITGLAIGDNLIVLTAMLNQCASISDTVLLHVDDLFIPEGYSPNGDGVNDRWEIRGMQAYPGSSLEVFNRWGKLIYATKGYANEWDGRSRNGQELPDDTYFYVLNLTGRRTYNGPVIIKR